MIIQCSACNTRYHYDEARFAGAPAKKIRCTKCSTVFEIRNPALDAPPPAGFQADETSSISAPMPGSDDFNFDTTVMGPHRKRPVVARPPEPVAAPAPVPAPEPAPTPVTVTKEFNLSSDVLFDFGKSSLKPEGVSALDILYDQIKAETPKDGTALVVGYTDRIGSDASNQVLSEQRAKTVADYLVGKGIPADKISTQGRGEAESVTGTQCDGIKAKKELISCLAPDRRVSISVTGTKEVTE